LPVPQLCAQPHLGLRLPGPDHARRGPDLGILACTDPIAIDQACLDLLDARPGRRVYRRGRQALAYGEKLGMGSRTYTLQRLDAP
jgi:uncharacterized Fe-S center protein